MKYLSIIVVITDFKISDNNKKCMQEQKNNEQHCQLLPSPNQINNFK